MCASKTPMECKSPSIRHLTRHRMGTCSHTIRRPNNSLERTGDAAASAREYSIQGSVKRCVEENTGHINTGRTIKVNVSLVVFYSKFIPYSWHGRPPGAFRLAIEIAIRAL